MNFHTVGLQVDLPQNRERHNASNFCTGCKLARDLVILVLV